MSVEGLDTRPTTDRVKESVFNMIQHQIYQAKCLDLYAGSGALGIELLSRGAESCMFVDSGKAAISCIRSNLDKTKMTERANVVQKDVSAALAQLNEDGFDFIMMDPPYFKGEVKKTLDAIAAKNMLSEDGYVVVEHGVGDSDVEMLNMYYDVIKRKTYGKISILILRRSHENSSLSGEF